jgi:SprT-like family
VEAATHEKPGLPEPKLQELFHRYNRRYFGGKLPSYRIEVSDRWAGGRCEFRSRTIYLHPPDSTTRGVLLHEMCHAAVGRAGHGPRFLAKLRRLKLAGAPVEDYDVTASIGSNEILGMAGAAGLETGWDWKAVRRDLGYGNGLIDKFGTAADRLCARLLRQMRAAFYRGRKERVACSVKFRQK